MSKLSYAHASDCDIWVGDTCSCVTGQESFDMLTPEEMMEDGKRPTRTETAAALRGINPNSELARQLLKRRLKCQVRTRRAIPMNLWDIK